MENKSNAIRVRYSDKRFIFDPVLNYYTDAKKWFTRKKILKDCFKRYYVLFVIKNDQKIRYDFYLKIKFVFFFPLQ